MHFAVLDFESAQANMTEILACSKDISDWTADSILTDLKDKWEYSFLSIERKEIIGYAIISTKFDYPHLHQLMVRQDWRSKGIGQKMIRHMCNQFERFTLKVHRSNHRGIQFYEKNGLLIIDESGEYIWMATRAFSAMDDRFAEKRYRIAFPC